jgi:exosome complex RNA-binding protein Rrp42 (RNase PH superfamily)
MEDLVETFQTLDPVAYIQKFTSSNVRPDTRSLHAIRPTTIVPSILPRNTNGSSLLQLGKTQIITAITLSIGTPTPSFPNHGEISFSLHMTPLCSAIYNLSGRIIHSEESSSGNSSSYKTLSAISSSDTSSMESYIQRTLFSNSNDCNNDNLVHLPSLCIVEGKSAWKVHVHCMVVNHDGNIVDAAMIGCIAALKDLRLPPVKILKDGTVRVMSDTDDNYYDSIGNGQDETRDNKMMDIDPSTTTTTTSNNATLFQKSKQKRRGRPISFNRIPIPLTFILFDGKILADPTSIEESVADGSITVVVDANTVDEKGTNMNNATILSLQKMGSGSMVSIDKMVACVKLCLGRALELRNVICDLGNDDDDDKS